MVVGAGFLFCLEVVRGGSQAVLTVRGVDPEPEAYMRQVRGAEVSGAAGATCGL